jgi:hypothetical protein
MVIKEMVEIGVIVTAVKCNLGQSVTKIVYLCSHVFSSNYLEFFEFVLLFGE